MARLDSPAILAGARTVANCPEQAYNATSPGAPLLSMNQLRRILHVISRLDGYGGARMLRYLARHDVARGRRPIVAALGADPAVVEELRTAGVEVHVLNARWRFDPLAIVRMRLMRRRHPADRVHAWDAAAHRYALLSGRRKSLVIEQQAAEHAPQWMLRLPGQSLVSTPRGVPSPTPSRYDRAHALRELDLPSDARVIAVAGPLERRKRVDEAVWSFELVRVLHPQARLVVFGDGPDRPRLERFAAAVSEAGCVRFAGFRGDLTDLLPHADVYWQLDASRETPHALLEAMSASVPAVVSDVPAHRRLVAPEENGFVAAFNNRAEVARATDLLLSNQDLAERLGRSGAHSVARQFSLEDACSAWERIGSTPNASTAPVTLPTEMP